MTSTFAPPTGPPATGSSPTPLADLEPIPFDSSTSGGRRRPFALAAAVVAVVALGIGAFVALSGSRSGGEVAGPYSLLAAAESTIVARTVEFDLTVSASELAAVSVSGAVDNETELVSVTTDLSSLLALGDTPMPLGDGEMTLLLDGANGVVYLDASTLGGFLPDGAAWVSIDLVMLAEQAGQSLDELQGELVFDPSGIAESLLDPENAVEIGIETIDGVEVKHFQVTVDIAAAIAALPQADLGEALEGVDVPDIDVPDTLVYDVWVTADNDLRRVSFDTELAGQTIAMQLDMTTSDQPLDIEVPTDAFDLSGLLGF
jgi:hypothetical protein